LEEAQASIATCVATKNDVKSLGATYGSPISPESERALVRTPNPDLMYAVSSEHE